MIIVGIDEVGRGCWAGPVVAGAVVLRAPIAALADSKVLTKQRREALAKTIYGTSEVGLGWVDAATIDRIGLTEAVRLAMRRALEQITQPYDRVIIDGHFNFLADTPEAVALIKADATVPAVSAASIVAKVARDEYMTRLSNASLYGFDKHVGYGTALHRKMLKLHGVSDEHRKSVKPIAALLQ